jgi:effector-binding domain-containing protein
MFRLKQAQIQQVIETEQARLERIAARISQIEQEGNMSTYDVRLKQVESVLVTSIRETISLQDDPQRLYEILCTYLREQGVQQPQPGIVLWHSPYELHDDGFYADIEVGIPVREPLPTNGQVSMQTLPGGLMACIVHTGTRLSIGQAYVALCRWSENNNYRVIAPPRQVNLQNTDEGQHVVELQFAVEK